MLLEDKWGTYFWCDTSYQLSTYPKCHIQKLFIFIEFFFVLCFYPWFEIVFSDIMSFCEETMSKVTTDMVRCMSTVRLKVVCCVRTERNYNKNDLTCLTSSRSKREISRHWYITTKWPNETTLFSKKDCEGNSISSNKIKLYITPKKRRKNRND